MIIYLIEMVLKRHMHYLFFFIFISISFSKSYSIDQVEIESIIKENGTVEFVEKRTFDFRGKYSYVYQDIPKIFFAEIYDIQVSEDGRPYLNKNSSEPYTFQVIENKNRFRIKWFHESVDIKKKFQLSYKVNGSLRIGPEDSQFYWPYIGKNWNKSNFQISIIQRFEKKIPSQDIWYEAKSKRKIFESEYIEDGFYRLEIDRIRKNRILKINTIFPTSYLVDPLINDSRFKKFEYLEAKQLKLEKSAIGFKVALALAMVSLFSFIFRLIKYGKEYKIKEDIYGNSLGFPSEHHPSLVSYLVTRQKVSGLSILASIFNLSKKGYLKIEEKNIEKKSMFGNKTEKKIQISLGEIGFNNDNEKWDKTIFNFVNKVTDGSPKSLDEIFGKMVYESVFMSELKTSINEKLKKFEWIEYPSRSATFSFAIFNFILFFASLVLLLYNIPASIIASIMIALFGLIGSLSINRMSIKCSELRKKWQEFSLVLNENSEKYSHLDNNRLLQYSIVLGLKKEDIKKIIRHFDFSESGEFHWFYAGDYGGSGLDSFSSMIDTGSTLSASFSGDGGGGAGGGGGGGGGAG